MGKKSSLIGSNAQYQTCFCRHIMCWIKYRLKLIINIIKQVICHFYCSRETKFKGTVKGLINDLKSSIKLDIVLLMFNMGEG